MVTRPMSLSVRMRRPTACMSLMLASGTVISMKGLPPWSEIQSLSVLSMGLSGMAKGSLAMMTCMQAKPGKSKPSAKLSSPKIMLTWLALILAKCCSSKAALGMSPCTNKASKYSLGKRIATSCICLREENNTSVPMPCFKSMSCGSHSAIIKVWPLASFGLTGRRGKYNSPWVPKSNGDSKAKVVVSGSHCKPVWRNNKSKLPKLCKVAEVNTAPAARRHKRLASKPALDTGEAQNK